MKNQGSNLAKKSIDSHQTHGLLAKALSLTGNDDAIIETDGIFSIKKDLDISHVTIDPELKELIDTVLK